jgi:hypothetical protein
MAKLPTRVELPSDPATNPQGPAGVNHLSDDNLARGGVIGLGYVPHGLAKDNDDRRVGALDAEHVVFTTAAGVDVTVPHLLRRVPRRFILVNGPASVNVQVFRGATAWTDSRAYFRASTTGDKVTVEIA